MTVPVLVGVPLVLLVIVLLLGFVGCAEIIGIRDWRQKPTLFDDAVLAVPSLVAWWHLNDAPGSPTQGEVPGMAMDSKNGHHGQYFEGEVAADPVQQSAFAPGKVAAGVNLIPSEPDRPSMFVDGGYALIDWSSDLNTDVFTIQAFVLPQWNAQDDPAYRCVIFSEQSVGATRNGFSLYANPENKWEFFAGDGTTFHSVAASDPIALDARAFLVAICNGATLSLYVDAQLVASTNLLSYEPNTGMPLAIGQALPGEFNAAFPFNGDIAEVAYYNGVVDEQTIFALGLTSSMS